MATHYVARELTALGHDVKQVPPAYRIRKKTRVSRSRRCRSPPLCRCNIFLLFATLCWPLPAVAVARLQNARQFSVSCMLTGSAAAPEMAVVPIKSAFLALRSVP